MFSGLLLAAALLAPAADPATAPRLLTRAESAVQAPAVDVPPPADPGAIPAVEPGAPDRPSLKDTHSGPGYSAWGEADFLMYWLKQGPSPTPLLTTPGGILLGNDKLDFGRAVGGRVGIGVWMNDRHTFGFMAGGFMLEQRSAHAIAGSAADGTPVLSRPFTDALLATPGQLLVASPGLLAGGLATDAGARLSGAEVSGIYNIGCARHVSLDFLAGFRYLDLDEFLAITQSGLLTGTVPIPFGGTTYLLPGPTELVLTDRFRTRNQFFGGEVGGRGEVLFGPVGVCVLAKVGMGTNHQTIDIDGSSRLGAPGAVPLPGGLLAVEGANRGRQVSNRFAVLTEVGGKVGVQVTKHLRATIGYEFLYLNNVARPGSQIDPVVNTRLVPTSANFGGVGGLTSPLPTQARDDFFAHGVRLGVEWQY